MRPMQKKGTLPGWLIKAGTVLALGFVLMACTGNRPLAEEEFIAHERPSSLYRIQPGDKLKVFVWRNPEVSIDVVVRPDGHISTPLVQDMDAAGKTPSQLADDLEASLKTFIKSPIVTVIVQDFHGNVNHRIRAIGEVRTPSILSFQKGMTLLDLMIEVGGLTEYASGNEAKIIRRENEGLREIPVRLDDLLNGGDMTANIPLKQEDILIVPESFL